MTHGAAAALVVAALALVACKDVTSQDPVVRVEMLRTKCAGDCPAYSVALGEDGRVAWDGEAYVKTRGKKELNIGPQRFHSLATDVDALGFDAFRTMYPSPRADGPTVVVVVARKSGKTKRIEHHYDADAPGELEALEHGIDEVAGSRALIGNPNEHEAYKPEAPTPEGASSTGATAPSGSASARPPAPARD